MELEGQCVQENEIEQFKEDVIHHTDVEINQIIDRFANLRDVSFDSNLCHHCGDAHNSDEDCFGDDGPSIFNEASEWWVEPPESSDDDDDMSSDNDNDDLTPADAPHPAVDDLNGNSDTDDGAENVATLIQSNMHLTVL